MADLSNPVIVVPGIIATYLRDEYPLPPDMVWTVMTKSFERSTLHPDDLRYESQQPARVVPDQIYEIAYKELISELRHNLAEKEDKPVPVFPFGYDWRLPLVETQAKLGAFIDEVIGRTLLLRHYANSEYANNPRVNLIGHSMGGLIIAGHLKAAGKDARVAKVATLASPFRGSFEAVLKVITGTASIGGGEPSSREREAARLTPALYHLLPHFEGALELAEGVTGSLFEPNLWQPSVVDTIAEYIRLHGLNPTDRKGQAQALFEKMLDAARKHRTSIDGLDLAKANLTPNDWLCVVGADCETRVRLRIAGKPTKPEFLLSSSDRQNLWEKGQTSEERRMTGDGTVPLLGAVPKFLQPENLVCITPDDYGYWEVQDKLTSKVGGFHGILPNMNMLHRMLVRHFTGRPDWHKNTWGRPLPGIEPANWKPPLRLDLP